MQLGFLWMVGDVSAVLYAMVYMYCIVHRHCCMLHILEYSECMYMQYNCVKSEYSECMYVQYNGVKSEYSEYMYI